VLSKNERNEKELYKMLKEKMEKYNLPKTPDRESELEIEDNDGYFSHKYF